MIRSRSGRCRSVPAVRPTAQKPERGSSISDIVRILSGQVVEGVKLLVVCRRGVVLMDPLKAAADKMLPFEPRKRSGGLIYVILLIDGCAAYAPLVLCPAGAGPGRLQFERRNAVLGDPGETCGSRRRAAAGELGGRDIRSRGVAELDVQDDRL